MIGFDMERRENLIQQTTMLRGDTHANVKSRIPFQIMNGGTKFDGFGTSPEDEEELRWGLSGQRSVYLCR